MGRKHGMSAWLAKSFTRPDAEPVGGQLQAVVPVGRRVLEADPEAAQRLRELKFQMLVAHYSGEIVKEQALARGTWPYKPPEPDLSVVVPLPNPPELPPKPRVKIKRKGICKRWGKT